jgi:hypothetical protein
MYSGWLPMSAPEAACGPAVSSRSGVLCLSHLIFLLQLGMKKAALGKDTEVKQRGRQRGDPCTALFGL